MFMRKSYFWIVILVVLSLVFIFTLPNSSEKREESIAKNAKSASSLSTSSTKGGESSKSSVTQEQSFGRIPSSTELAVEAAKANQPSLAPLTAEQETRFRGSLMVPTESLPIDVAVPGAQVSALAEVGGQKIELRPNQSGIFQRLHCETNQVVTVTVTYPEFVESEVVYLGLTDGGFLQNDGEELRTDDKGQFSFSFKAGPDVGTYGIIMTTESHDVKTFDFWAGLPEWEEPIIRTVKNS